jgi:AraC-like DNA-binding protein
MAHRPSTLDDWSAIASEARAFITANASTPGLSIREVADTVDVSARKLQRALAYDGTDFTREILVARMQIAAQTMSRGASVRLARRFCGYRSDAHFTRTFERYFGVTPRTYRRIAVLEDRLNWRDWQDEINPVSAGSHEYFRRRKRRGENVREVQRLLRPILPNGRTALLEYAPPPRKVIDARFGRRGREGSFLSATLDVELERAGRVGRILATPMSPPSRRPRSRRGAATARYRSGS